MHVWRNTFNRVGSGLVDNQLVYVLFKRTLILSMTLTQSLLDSGRSRNSISAQISSMALRPQTRIQDSIADSRIHSPNKDDFRREVVRLRGGDNNHVVVGTLEIRELKDFQSHHCSPSGPYKPIPMGFEISGQRMRIES